MSYTASPMVINQNIIDMEYAVRGPIPARAAELKKQGRNIVFCNIGNPQAQGQKPVTYYRQVLSLAEDPSRIQHERKIKNMLKDVKGASELSKGELMSDYILDFAERILANIETGMGAYTDSRGPLFIREAIARYIDKRDNPAAGGVPSNPNNIFLTNGASEGVRFILEMLISGKNDGIMIPTPQYPLYSATIKKCGGVQVNFYPDEDNDWNLNRSMLEEAISEAKKNGVNVKAIVAINPGNPTGAILDERSLKEVIEFAKDHNLAILADEVYQENTYGAKFTSFAKMIGADEIPLFSLHSISKGFYGECGHRGGYLEVRNAPKIQGTQMILTDILVKQASVSLCSNTVGQLLTYLMVNPPEEGTEPYALFVQEKESILKELYEKALIVKDAFKQMDGMKCFGRVGALYLFPRIEKLPKGTNDFEYCMNLLEKTGLCTVNGSGFGQKAGTHHLRTTFLPPREKLAEVLPKWIAFHNEYVNQ